MWLPFCRIYDRKENCVRKYDFISALAKETAAEVVKNREEWMKYLITAVSFLITDFSRSKSLYQMIGFVRTVLPAMVKGVLKVNRCCFRYCLPALQSDSDWSWFVQALYYNFADNCNRHHTHIHIKLVCVRKLTCFSCRMLWTWYWECIAHHYWDKIAPDWCGFALPFLPLPFSFLGYKKTAVKCSIFTTVCFMFYSILGVITHSKL